MPQLTLKQLLLSNTTGVPLIEHQSTDGMFGSGIGKMVKDVVQADLSKGGPRVEFYKNLPSLYSTSLPIIESQGSIDIGRTKAVAAAHYNGDNGSALGMGKILSLGNLLGGSANRPSDTIFRHEGRDKNAPVSINGQPINGDYSGLKYAVEAGVNYDVSTQPAGTNGLTGLLKGTPEDIAKKAVGAATDALKNKVRSLAVGALTSKRRKNADSLKAISDGKNKPISHTNNTYEEQGSWFIKSSGKNDPVQLISRFTNNLPTADKIINTINENDLMDGKALADLIKLNTNTKLQYIKIKVLGTYSYLVFPAAISDISETITTDIADFKYVGSPFKVYRYNGVERTLKFDFQVYWLDNGQQTIMERKLNNLREIAFPSKYLTSVNIGDTQYSPLVFSPNLIQLSIGDLYQNVKGIVSNLTIGVAQKTTWASSSPDFKSKDSVIYPNVVDVSFEMKIIENHDVDGENETITYRFTKNDEFNIKKQAIPNLPKPIGGPDYGYNDNGIKTQSRKDSEIGTSAENANGWDYVGKGVKRPLYVYDENGNITNKDTAGTPPPGTFVDSFGHFRN
jgi:hypothetical protein